MFLWVAKTRKNPYSIRQQIVALEHTPMSRATVSHYLKILKQAGLVNVQKKGTEMFYRLEITEAIRLFKQLVTFE
ncbi:ArsR/SmtB family transcription factor [Brevibacillus antibioticus]|uniref:ArsR/SmtB family transcription factor n=1 Tax=Brevibacillus antibioticus TaxID=2570228 RepID=UPI003CC56E70